MIRVLSVVLAVMMNAPLPVPASSIVVIGGTPGGVATAVTAARLGHDVTLVEYHPHLGGMASSGLGWSDIEDRSLVQGIFREFVDRVKAHYVEKYGEDSENVKLCKDGYRYEPSVAEHVFDTMVAEQPRITVLKNHELTTAEMTGDQLVAVTVKDRRSGRERTLSAPVFADATYEGDLVAACGAEFRLGREARDEFDEPHAGHIYHAPGGERMGGTGASDSRMPAFTFRIPLARDPANQTPLTQPDGYDRTRYLGYLDDLKTGRFGKNLFTVAFTVRVLPNNKVELNMKPKPLGFVFAEENIGYIEGDWAARERITAKIRDLSLGLLWFLKTDPVVPENARSMAATYGLPLDEFSDNHNFPFQLYVREGRRLVGEYTLSERNITEQPELKSERVHADAVAAGDYPIDSFPTQKRQPGDTVVLEGYLGMLFSITRPYQYPYRIMVPKRVDGLIVPVPASATHVAFSSLRMEPTWMALGQAAGIAAHLAITRETKLRAIPIGELQAELRKQGAVIDIPAQSSGGQTVPSKD